MSRTSARVRLLIASLFLLVLAGCTKIPEDRVFRTPIPDGWNIQILRYVDREAGVVCYTYQGRGLSCLPLGSTKLR